MHNKISVIIPHHNSPHLLLNAIRSVSSVENIQVIVVDDKSDLDESWNNRIDVFCKEHDVLLLRNTTSRRGAGACRNIGLDHANGEWILFLDADDYLNKQWYNIVSKYLDKDFDMIYFKPFAANLYTGERDYRTYLYETLIDNYVKAPSRKNEQAVKYRFVTCHSKLIRRSLIVENNLQFDEIVSSEDVLFMTKCAYTSKKILICNDNFYIMTRSCGTLTSTKDKSFYMNAIKVMIQRYHFLENKLSTTDFKNLHMSWYALARLIDGLFGGYGFDTIIDVIKLYHKYRVKWFDVALLNPINLYSNLKIELLWWRSINHAENIHRR